LYEIATWNTELEKAVLTKLTNGAPIVDIADDIEEPDGAADEDQVNGVFGNKRVPISNLTCLQWREMEKVKKQYKIAKTGRIETATKIVDGESVDVWIAKRTIKGDAFLTLMEGKSPGSQIAQLKIDTVPDYDIALNIMKELMSKYTTGTVEKVACKKLKDEMARSHAKVALQTGPVAVMPKSALKTAESGPPAKKVRFADDAASSNAAAAPPAALPASAKTQPAALPTAAAPSMPMTADDVMAAMLDGADDI